MSFFYDPALGDAISRVRGAVGDTVSPGLLPDETYESQLALTTTRRQMFTAAAASNTCEALGHGLADRTPVIVQDLTTAIGVTAGAIVYVRDAETDTFALTTTPTGAAIDLTLDGEGVIGVVSEGAAIRAIAAMLAVRYAQKPTDVRLTSGLSISWGQRVQQWNRIAAGQAGGSAAARVGMGTLRYEARDYELGERR